MVNSRLAHLSVLVIILAAMVEVQAHAAPANDHCADARVAKMGGNPFTNVGADVAAPAACAVIGADVWFKFTSTFTGELVVSTCSETNFNTVIAVYSGCACTSFNQLGCNAVFAGCGGGGSLVVVPVQAGACYRIRVAGLNGATGTGLLHLSVNDPQNAAAAHVIKTGNAAGDRFGSAVAGNGKINGDAIEDVLVGAPFSDQTGSDAGRAFAYKGSNLGLLLSKAGVSANDRFGSAVALVDVNDDGREDLIIGAPRNDLGGTDAGCVYAYSGFNGALLWKRKGAAAGDQFGFSVAPAGDFNNAGFGDVIVGAPFNDAGGADAGRVYILNGANGKSLKVLTGRAAGDNFGFSVANIGDLNNDGRADFAVGAPMNDTRAADAGQVTVFAGGTGAVLKRFDGDSAGDQFGYALAGQRFVAGSHYVMMAVGAPFNNNGGGADAGRVKVYLRNLTIAGQNGCNAILCLKYTMNGGNPGDRFGSSLAIGDLVGTAIADIVVGAPNIGLNGANSGAVYVFDGATGIQAGKFYGEAAGDNFASSVAIAGDINNDGNDDIIVGGPNNDAKANNAGRAYVFFINPTSLRSADVAGPRLPAADLNRDGFVDATDVSIVISAWGACETNDPCAADIDRDGVVNVNDLIGIINGWRGWADPTVIES